jgi:hypothetical protein
MSLRMLADHAASKRVFHKQPSFLCSGPRTIVNHHSVGRVVDKLEDHEIIGLLGSRVRVRNGSHTFEGTLLGPSDKNFAYGSAKQARGLVLQGKDFQLDFAWWDWKVQPLAKAELIASE